MRSIAIPIIGLLIVVAIAWDASERHYDACVHAAKARTPVGWGVPAGVKASGSGAAPTLIGIDERRHAVRGCSRLPW